MCLHGMLLRSRSKLYVRVRYCLRITPCVSELSRGELRAHLNYHAGIVKSLVWNRSTHDFVSKKHTKFGWTLIRLNLRTATRPQSKPWIAVFNSQGPPNHNRIWPKNYELLNTLISAFCVHHYGKCYFAKRTEIFQFKGFGFCFAKSKSYVLEPMWTPT